MSVRRSAALLAGAGYALSACSVAPPARTDTLSLGRNVAGEACVASRSWNDPATPDPFDRAYALTCSNATASRPLGNLRVVERSAAAIARVDAQFDCGDRREVPFAGRVATAGRCVDRVTGLSSIRIDLDSGTKRYVGSATPALLPQIEAAIALASGLRRPDPDVTRTPAAEIDLAALGVPPAEGPAMPAVASAPTNTAGALVRGIAFNHRGLHVEASRVLNDALGRLEAGVPPSLRAELLLEAGLADSNIRFAEAAQGHFAAADAILTGDARLRSVFLVRKRNTYRALDALNRAAFADAIAILDTRSLAPSADAQPLQNPETLLAINQPAAGDSSRALALADAGQLSRLVLDVQAEHVRSVALLASGNAPGATAAIERAAALYRPLANDRLDQAQLFWLGARIARQKGRLQARGGDYDDALDSFDTALDLLRRGSIANAGTGAEPAIAEAELERAAIYARTGASRNDARRTFGDAVDSLIASGATSAGGSIGMEDYLDLLVREAGNNARPDTYDRFFRAVQASGEPDIARQITELRNVVTADPVVGAAVRERADLEREITRLRFAMSSDAEGAGSTAGLERARDAAEDRLLAVDAQLAADPRYRTLDESPATLAELRGILRPGEVFVKLTTLNRRVYGMVVTGNATFIYHVADSDAARQAVNALAEQLRASIDGNLGAGQLVPFDEARAYTLYRLVAGPAAEVLANAKAIVVDPSGPLQQLPIGVLVTRYAADQVRSDPFDFSGTAFLASNASISTALSPRSFLVSRALPASRAGRTFIGFGQHQPPPAASDSARAIRVGFGCSVGETQLNAIARSLKPINSRELGIAVGALGVADAQFVTGSSFSDTAVEARGDLDQFEVVHFATHGLEEGMWGCSKSPPALVTSFGAPQSDGLLDFAEIARLRFDANLVVLSACDTATGVRAEALLRGSGREQAGATLEGLVRAFLTANARSVLATYWQVSAEQESEEFMRVFYAGARTGTIGQALQGAQRALIARPEYSHPFYWAPYFLVGDSAKPMLSQDRSRIAQR